MKRMARMNNDKRCSSRFSGPQPSEGKIPFGHPTGMRLERFCAIYNDLLDTRRFILAMPTDGKRAAAAMYFGDIPDTSVLDAATRRAARELMAMPDHPADLDLQPKNINFASACWWAATNANAELLVVRAKGQKPSEIAECVLQAILDHYDPDSEGQIEIDCPPTDTPVPTLALGWAEAEWLEIMRKWWLPDDASQIRCHAGAEA